MTILASRLDYNQNWLYFKTHSFCWNVEKCLDHKITILSLCWLKLAITGVSHDSKSLKIAQMSSDYFLYHIVMLYAFIKRIRWCSHFFIWISNEWQKKPKNIKKVINSNKASFNVHSLVYVRFFNSFIQTDFKSISYCNFLIVCFRASKNKSS